METVPVTLPTTAFKYVSDNRTFYANLSVIADRFKNAPGLEDLIVVNLRTGKACHFAYKARKKKYCLYVNDELKLLVKIYV